MSFEIRTLDGIDTTIGFQPSFSYTRDALFISAVTQGESEIINPHFNKEILEIINNLGNFGVSVKKTPYSLVIKGRKYLNNPGKKIIAKGYQFKIFCILSSLVQEGYVTIDGDNPIGLDKYLYAIKDIGIENIILNVKGGPPVKIKGNCLKGGVLELNSEHSWEYISSLLISLPYAKKRSSIKHLGNLTSFDKISQTLSLMKIFENDAVYESGVFHVPNSSYRKKKIETAPSLHKISYFLGAAAIHKGNIIADYPENNFILDIFREMGCSVSIKEKITLTGPKVLKPVVVDLSDYPDYLPLLCIVCSFADGISEFMYTYQENHVDMDELKRVLSSVGVKTTLTGESIVIHGGMHRGATIDSKDYRIIMSLAIMGLKVSGINIEYPEILQDYFPNFWKILKRV